MKSNFNTSTSSKPGQDATPSTPATTTATPVAAKADTPVAHNSEFSIEVTKKTTPKEIREWIAKLEELVEQKKQRVRDDLAAQVNGLLAANEYTVEELLGARILPSTADLAEQAKKAKDAAKQRASKLADSTLGS